MVPRAASVDVTGYDENGEPVRLRKSGWAARIMQHEHDHMSVTFLHFFLD